MKVYVSSQLLIPLAWTLHAVFGNPLGALPSAAPVEQPELNTLITTVTDQQSAYTLTYVPTTITAATTLVEGTSTTTADTGAVVAVLAGGAAAAALPLAIPKAIPQPVPEAPGPEVAEDDGQDGGCEEKTAQACSEQCTADWFISSKKVQTTSQCATATCAETVGCSVSDITKTVTQPIPTPTVTSLTATSPVGTATPPPLDYQALQVYLGDEYLRLHIDGNPATCETDPAKGVLEIEGVKANIADFCKSNNGIGASPNSGLLITYNQDVNRMQVVLQVLYTGGRGQDAIYTVEERKCNDMFAKILPCGPDQDHTSGGNVTNGKGVFVLEPYTYSGKLDCAPEGGKYGVVQDEALANIDDFCGQFDGQTINQGERKDDRYFQNVGGLTSTVSVTYEPNTIGCEDGGPFDHGYLINKAACKRFLGQTINDCNQDQPNFKAAGTITDQCARYQLFVESREKVVCGSDPRFSEDVRATYKPFDPNVAHEAIKGFCDKNLLADPAAVDPNGGFSQYGDWPKGIAKGGTSGAHAINIEVRFHTAEALHPWCDGIPENRAFKTGGDDCARRLGKVLVDGCDTEKDAQKRGGTLIDPGPDGCVQWEIWGL